MEGLLEDSWADSCEDSWEDSSLPRIRVIPRVLQELYVTFQFLFLIRMPNTNVNTMTRAHISQLHCTTFWNVLVCVPRAAATPWVITTGFGYGYSQIVIRSKNWS
jgi:hypothetical protein